MGSRRLGLAKFEAALALHKNGRFEPALASYNAALRADPQLVAAYNNRGIALSQLGRTVEALASFEQAVAIDPVHADALANRGLALGQLGRFVEALASFDAALAAQPGHHLAAACREEAAVTAMRSAASQFARAESLADAGHHAEALAAFAAAAACDPAMAHAPYGEAAMHWQLGDAAAALAGCDRALARAPGLGPAHNLRGRALQQVGRAGEALAAFERAIACNPDDASAHQNRAWRLRSMGQIESALVALERARVLDPALPFVAGEILEMRMHLCDWDFHDAARDALLGAVADGTIDAVPFALISLTDDPALQRTAAVRFMAQSYPRVGTPIAPYARGEKLRVAYLSADFHAHATMYLLADTLACHDRTRFEITALSYGKPAADPWRARAEAAAARFIDVREMSDSDIAALARALHIDVAIDLKGLTGDGRPGILAARAAPVQAGYLGYPGTMPAPFLDYFIGDSVVNSVEERGGFAEALALLPASYQPNCRLASTAEPAGSRADHGLPIGGLVLCCFSANYKISPAVFASWMTILAAVPGSVLWLWADQARTRDNLRRSAAAHGIAPERLVFADFAERDAHLARLAHADLSLDTFPYGAHTTASDALRAGLPLVTRPGRTFASRVGASLLTAVGLPELIAASPDDYTQLAISLARDPKRIKALRGRLREFAPHAPLFDPARQARHLESAYLAMDERARRGEMPADFAVTGA